MTKAFWSSALKPFGVDEAAIESTYADVSAAYEGEGRYYHTLAHIGAMLQYIQPQEDVMHDRAAIYLAVYFHDVIYHAKANDNEERSADKSREVLTQLGIPPATIDATCRMILATKTHQAETNDLDTQILLDADLAILGQDPAIYQQYVQNVRKEYGWLSDEEWRTGRARVMRNFLARPRLYYTDRMFNKLEAQARINIQNELAALEN